jgi:Fe-S cluster assembly iron-binding protein IscA
MGIELTPHAVEKVKEIMAQQNPAPIGLRVSVVGGGCSGFSYQMNFETHQRDRQNFRVRRPEGHRRSRLIDVSERDQNRLR